MESLQDREAIKEKIEGYLRSNNPEMVKLGRTLCHNMRVDYYVLVRKYVFGLGTVQYTPTGIPQFRVATKSKTISYSVYPFEEPTTQECKTYQIKLEKWS
jgi:hypothetical protein